MAEEFAKGQVGQQLRANGFDAAITTPGRSSTPSLGYDTQSDKSDDECKVRYQAIMGACKAPPPAPDWLTDIHVADAIGRVRWCLQPGQKNVLRILPGPALRRLDRTHRLGAERPVLRF